MNSTVIPWDKLEHVYMQLTKSLAEGSLSSKERVVTQKQFSLLHALLEQYHYCSRLRKEIELLQVQVSLEQDSGMVGLIQDEIAIIADKLHDAQLVLENQLYPPNEHDDRSVYMEIRAGAGGQEAALFVADLLKMYTHYALSKGWKATVESAHSTDLGGFREIIIFIQGKNVFGSLKYESGVVRVQRVPATETSGRIHTSTATIAVLPEAKEVDVVINPSDLKIDYFRASGAGGQHVNTTDSAVRITHVPTGITVSCQDERSQHKNRLKAMGILRSRILAARLAEHEATLSEERKKLIGSGMRSEKNRTYNFPQNRVTDHRIGLTLKKLDSIMNGDLDEIINELKKQDRMTGRESFVLDLLAIKV
ncbi:MAG: peptide chain release factor 1 [Candidatus Babeliales bacterium]